MISKGYIHTYYEGKIKRNHEIRIKLDGRICKLMSVSLMHG